MTYKTINVLVDTNSHLNTRLTIASDLAEDFNSHLVGLHVIPPINFPSLATAELPADVLAQRYDSLQDTAQSLRCEFEAKIGTTGINWEWRCLNAIDGDLRGSVAEVGRYADLNIVTQSEPDLLGTNDVDFAEPLLFHSGRPVLVIPYAGSYSARFKKILIAWDGSKPSVRAVHDALPLLTRADEVSVLTVNPKETSEAGHDYPGIDITTTLARHDVIATVKRIPGATIPISDMLLSTVADDGYDLLVMGGYGHSKVREWVFGGTTHNILKNMTVPVLMSH